MSPLLCPLCARPLVRGEHTFSCDSRHSFDIAAAGYVNLLTGRAPAVGDNRAMIAARRRTLDSGVYAPLKEALTAAAAKAPRGTYLDAGCGEGYYTEAMARGHRAALGIDISKDALRLAARRLPSVTFAVASAYHLPVPSASISLLSSVFSPLAAEEFARITAPGGSLLVAFPGPLHLFSLKEVLYDTPYENEVKDFSLAGFTLQEVETIAFSFCLPTAEAIADLFMMTPYYYRTPQKGRERLATLTSLTLAADFRLARYRRD